MHARGPALTPTGGPVHSLDMDMAADLPDLVNEVLQKQHAELLGRLETWLGRVEAAMDGRLLPLPGPLGPPPKEFDAKAEDEVAVSAELIGTKPLRQESKQSKQKEDLHRWHTNIQHTRRP